MPIDNFVVIVKNSHRRLPWIQGIGVKRCTILIRFPSIFLSFYYLFKTDLMKFTYFSHKNKFYSLTAQRIKVDTNCILWEEGFFHEQYVKGIDCLQYLNSETEDKNLCFVQKTGVIRIFLFSLLSFCDSLDLLISWLFKEFISIYHKLYVWNLGLTITFEVNRNPT